MKMPRNPLILNLSPSAAEWLTPDTRRIGDAVLRVRPRCAADHGREVVIDGIELAYCWDFKALHISMSYPGVANAPPWTFSRVIVRNFRIKAIGRASDYTDPK